MAESFNYWKAVRQWRVTELARKLEERTVPED